jgi:hypothetical protein
MCLSIQLLSISIEFRAEFLILPLLLSNVMKNHTLFLLS